MEARVGSTQRVAATLLDAWERGLALGASERSTALLSVAALDAELAEVEGLTIGEREARLLALRERLFGSRLTGVACCEACGERLELALDTMQLRTAPPRRAAEVEVAEAGGFRVRFRLPTLGDLARATTCDHDAFRREILERCIVAVEKDGEAATVGDVTDDVADVVVQRMGELDPQADVEIALVCPGCARSWTAPFDVGAFLWTEVDAWARRLLHDVHRLASAYGWREEDVLSMSPARRRLYLDMVGGA